MDSDFVPPTAELGDPVLWYADPTNPRDPLMGWVSQRPGVATQTLLVWAPALGFVEKASVRAKGDPALLDNPNWRQWGCWELAPWYQKVKRLGESMTAAIAASEKSAKRGNS